MDPDPAFTLRGSLEQLVPYTGLTLLCKGRGYLAALQCYCCPLTFCHHWPGLLYSPWDLYNCGPEADLVKQDCCLYHSPAQPLPKSNFLSVPNKEDGPHPESMQQPS